LTAFRSKFAKLKAELQKSIVGYDELLTDTLTAIFSKGHVLLEGVPGLGKTHLVKMLSHVLGLSAGRVQCTPDLMPADILGTQIVNENAAGRRALIFEKGPVFANVVLVDEINRATPKTQAALLEVMQEHAVTSGGERHILPDPFSSSATQNPMEMEGTYPLPEAQLDRFLLKLRVPFPSQNDLVVEISPPTRGGCSGHRTSDDGAGTDRVSAGAGPCSRGGSGAPLCRRDRPRFAPGSISAGSRPPIRGLWGQSAGNAGARARRPGPHRARWPHRSGGERSAQGGQGLFAACA